MAKIHLVVFLGVLIYLTVSCRAAIYTVGDNNGWDISTDLDSWTKAKTFLVGDVLLFQYSSYHSVCELRKEDFESCNTRNSVETSSSGNTTFPLTKAGDRYFACDNRMHCLGGMKVQVHVLQKPNSTYNSNNNSNGAPEASLSPGHGPAVLLPGTSKNGHPTLSSSAHFIKVAHHHFFLFLHAFLGCSILPAVL